MKNSITFLLIRIVFIFAVPICFADAAAASMENQFNADLQLHGAAVKYAQDSYYDLAGPDSGYDGQIALRLKDKLFFSDQIFTELHYEIYFNGGDTYEKTVQLTQNFPFLSDVSFIGSGPEDTHRLFNLTAAIEEKEDYALSHRLDRMLISIRQPWGDVTAGRQAVTWGNGLVFNPMDLFNPFAPSDTIRDYKTGDDLLSVRVDSERLGELNFLLVPRRNMEGDVDRKWSSLAAKTHLFIGTTELDVMLARHYEETVAGLGISGYLGGATYRSDVVWSTLPQSDNGSGFVNLVLNLDYSWVFGGKNMYGLIEYFHSGLGKDDYPAALLDPDIAPRLKRGELFTLGNDYLAGRIQIELHPLFNFYLSVISNVSDPSGIIQPRGVWSISEQAVLNIGANSCYGEKGTEFGGVPIPGSELLGARLYTTSPQSLYLLMIWYF